MDEENICFPYVEGKLSHRLGEGQAFDIPNGSADFGDEHIHSLPHGKDAFLYLICDMRDDLNGFPQVIASSLLANYGFIYLTGGKVVEATELSGGETFVVT